MPPAQLTVKQLLPFPVPSPAQRQSVREPPPAPSHTTIASSRGDAAKSARMKRR